MLRKINPSVLLVVGIAGVFIVGLLLWRSPLGMPNIFTDTSRASVVKEIQGLNRLETASYTVEKIVEAGQEGNVFQDLLYGDRLLLIAHGKVTAGIDLSQITEEDISVNGDKLIVHTPAPMIFSSSLDNSQTSVYDRSQGILSSGNKDLESEARRAAERSIWQAACDAGILDEARRNAQERLAQLFQFAGFIEVVITVPEGSC